jgi:hypothetical protein
MHTTARILLFLAGCALLAGCFGLSGGPISGRKTGFRVASQLKAGMSRAEAFARLAEGGALISTSHFIRDEKGAFVLVDGRGGDVAALHKYISAAPAQDAERVKHAYAVGRSWGFFGYDDFYLFFDDADILMLHRMLHVN